MEMTELWKANIRLSTAPWKSPRRREIPTFPQLRRRVVLRERKRTQKEKTEGRLHKNLDTAAWSAYSLLFIPIVAGNIILRHLMRANFPLVSVLGVLHALHRVGLERVSFLKQLVHTLRIRTLDLGQSLQISRLLARPRSLSFQSECHRIHALAFPPNLFFKYAHRFPTGCLLAADLRFHLRLFRSGLLFCQLLLGRYSFLSQLLLCRLLHRRHIFARSSLRLRPLLLGFLFGSHGRSLPPVGHS